MSEISLPKQLSGTEALESLLSEIRRHLRTNSRFQPHMAYAGFAASISVKFFPAASFIPAVEQDVLIESVPEDAVLSQTPTVDEVVEIPVRPPNQVREEADLPTPILTQDDNGNPVEKWVKKRGGIPKNKVRGAHLGEEPAVTMVATAIPSGR